MERTIPGIIEIIRVFNSLHPVTVYKFDFMLYNYAYDDVTRLGWTWNRNAANFEIHYSAKSLIITAKIGYHYTLK